MQFIDRNPLLATLNHAKGQILYRLGLRGHLSGTTASQLGPEGMVRYAHQVFDDYVRYGAGGDVGRIQGASVLEVGPGDNLAVALLFLAHGASRVTCADAFSPSADADLRRQVHRLLLESLSASQAANIRPLLQPGPGGQPLFQPGRLEYYYATPIEKLPQIAQNARYNLIVSRAVLEHVVDLEEGWAVMTSLLAPGGEMWHKVDLRAHGMYAAIHPLYFLTIPEWLWKVVSEPDPGLNRWRLPDYRAIAVRDFEEVDIYITHILSEKEITPHVPLEKLPDLIAERHLGLLQQIRPKLPRRLQTLPPEEILVNGIFLICRRPRGAKAQSGRPASV